MADGDFGYSQAFDSYTGGTGGSIVGDANWEFEQVSNVGGRRVDISRMNFFPNPADRSLVLSLQNQTTGFATLDIVNAAGVLAKRAFQGQLLRGEHRLHLDVSHLPSGVYIGLVRINGSIYQQRIVIK